MQDQIRTLLHMLGRLHFPEPIAATGAIAVAAAANTAAATAVYTTPEMQSSLTLELTQFLLFLSTLTPTHMDLSPQSLPLDPLLTLVSNARSPMTGSDGSGNASSAGQDSELVSALRMFMMEHLGNIEVMWDGRLERVCFPLSAQCRSLAISASWRDAVVKQLEWAAPETR